VDSDFAKASGYEDVFVHGMLVMAYLGRAIMAAFPPQTVRSYAVRFVAKTQVHAAITCEGTVDAVESGYIRLKLLARDELGDIKLTGAATLAREALLLR